MSAATAARDAQRKDADLQAYKIGATATVYHGTLVSVQVADGGAYPARSGTATDIFVGVARETKAGDGTIGDVLVRVDKRGNYLFSGSGFAQTDVGVAVYAADDSTVTKTSTSNQLVGYVQEVISATQIRVRIDGAVK